MKIKHLEIKNYRQILFIILLGFFALPLSYGQQNEELKLTNSEKQQVVDSVALFMTNYYVFPDVGKEMGNYVQDKMKAGEYKDVDNFEAFGNTLTEDLRSVSKDLHINVGYRPELISLMLAAEADEDNTELEELERRQAAYSNYNFKEIKILPGNVGYLKFNSFMHASESGPTAVAAMNFLSNTDALIIDLRDNGGGSPSLIQLITSYFFEYSEHLNSFYIREGDQTQQFWTLPYVPGNKLVTTELYILTSGNTFSGAEEFTYNLKNMERATVVGETTGGGAHPVSRYTLNDNFVISIPFGRAINPITNTNWEGIGVEPHIKTTRAEALDKAYVLALENLKEKETNDDIKAELNWAYVGLMAKLKPVSIDEKVLKQYVGKYGPRNIIFENGSLYYHRDDRPKMKMIPINNTSFMLRKSTISD